MKHGVVKGLAAVMEEEAVLESHVRANGARNFNPAFLICGRDQVERGEQESCCRRSSDAQWRAPTALRPETQQHNPQQCIAGHNARRRIHEPDAGDCSAERGDGRLGPHGEAEYEREQNRGHQLAVCGALICDEEHVWIGDVEASGCGGGERSKPVLREVTHAESAAEEADGSEEPGSSVPTDDGAKSRAEHPRGRRIEDKTRLAGAEVCGRGPVRIDEAAVPGAGGFKPRDKVEIEVMSAGGAAREQEAGCGKCGDQERGDGKRWPHSRCRRLVGADLHGVSRNVCSVARSTAAGVKGSAKVEAPYHAG